MALSPETKAWLDDLKKNSGLSDEAYKNIETSIEASAKADEFVKGSQLRQADYSRVMGEVQKSKKEADDALAALKSKEAAVTKFQSELGTWKAGAQENFDKAIKEREAATNKAAAAVARLKTVAQANGFDETELLKDLDVTPVPDKKIEPDKNVDMSQYVRKEDIQRTVAESALIDATIHDLAEEYFELTGNRLKGASAIVQEALASGKSLRGFIEEKFDFTKLRTTKADEAFNKRVEDEVKKRTEKILSESSLPGGIAPGRTDLHGSPIFEGADMFKAPPAPGAGGGGVSAAVAAFNEGKFKQ